MQKNARIFKIIGFVGLAVLIGIGLGWFASRPKTVATAPVATEESTAKSSNNDNKSATKPLVEAPEEPKEVVIPGINAPVTNEPDWGEKIGNILAADTEIVDKYKELLKLYPTFPEDGKIEAAKHLCNLVPDDDYADMGKLLADPKVPATVAEDVLFDLFNRPNSLKVPLMLQVARTPGHPGAEKAREDLALLLEDNYGTDWGRWERATQDYLKNNPD